MTKNPWPSRHRAKPISRQMLNSKSRSIPYQTERTRSGGSGPAFPAEPAAREPILSTSPGEAELGASVPVDVLQRRPHW